MQIETPVEEEHRAVAAVELNQLLAPFDPARVVGHRDDELEDDVIGQKIKEVLAFGQPIEPCLDHPEERPLGPGSPPCFLQRSAKPPLRAPHETGQ